MCVEIVVESKWVQGFPPLMPRQVEVHLEPQESMQLRQAAQKGELYVRIDTPDGERVGVRNLWINPHDPNAVTLILAS